MCKGQNLSNTSVILTYNIGHIYIYIFGGGWAVFFVPGVGTTARPVCQRRDWRRVVEIGPRNPDDNLAIEVKSPGSCMSCVFGVPFVRIRHKKKKITNVYKYVHHSSTQLLQKTGRNTTVQKSEARQVTIKNFLQEKMECYGEYQVNKAGHKTIFTRVTFWLKNVYIYICTQTHNLNIYLYMYYIYFVYEPKIGKMMHHVTFSLGGDEYFLFSSYCFSIFSKFKKQNLNPQKSALVSTHLFLFLSHSKVEYNSLLQEWGSYRILGVK